jgi:hypothetical protein
MIQEFLEEYFLLDSIIGVVSPVGTAWLPEKCIP